MKTKVLVYRTIQTIEEETYYSCSTKVWNKLKKAKTEKERYDIWKEFEIWDDDCYIMGEHVDNTTEEEIDFGVHNSDNE